MDNNHCQLKEKRFRLVDFASCNQPGFRNNIVDVNAVPALIAKYRYYECYTTCFLFPGMIRDYAQKSCKTCSRACSVSGYDGPAFAYYLPIDIDSKELVRAQQAAKQFLRFIFNELASDKRTVLAYFSGSAGFHLMIDTRIFGVVEPSEKLHTTFAILRKKLVNVSQMDRDSVDFSIKDKLRLWRLPNTVNRKSQFYKIQLSMEELFTLNVEQIKAKARNPQPIFYTDRMGLTPSSCFLKPNCKAEILYNESLELTKESVRPMITEQEIPQSDNFDTKNCLCKAEIKLATSRVRDGERNNSALRLIAKLRRKGFSRKNAEAFIREWNRGCDIQLPGNELISIVRSVYSRSYCYQYGCNDEILKQYCPYEKRNECRDYREFKETKERNEKTKAFSQQSL
jgi:hypothetical protein